MTDERTQSTEPQHTGKRVPVTSAQVMAARTRVVTLREKGEPVPKALWKIANARRADGTPVRIGIARLDSPFLTAEEIAATQPELSDALLGGINAMVRTLEQP